MCMCVCMYVCVRVCVCVCVRVRVRACVCVYDIYVYMYHTPSQDYRDSRCTNMFDIIGSCANLLEIVDVLRPYACEGYRLTARIETLFALCCKSESEA